MCTLFKCKNQAWALASINCETNIVHFGLLARFRQFYIGGFIRVTKKKKRGGGQHLFLYCIYKKRKIYAQKKKYLFYYFYSRKVSLCSWLQSRDQNGDDIHSYTSRRPLTIFKMDGSQTKQRSGWTSINYVHWKSTHCCLLFLGMWKKKEKKKIVFGIVGFPCRGARLKQRSALALALVASQSEVGEAAESMSSFSRSLGDDDWPPFTRFHFIRRFWNQTFTWWKDTNYGVHLLWWGFF